MNRSLKSLFLLLLVSRFLFLANYPHFYDSPEYLRLAQEKNFITALHKSHASIHPVYLFLSQLTFRLYRLYDFKDFTTYLSFLSAFFGLVTIICFYYLTKRLFNKRIALLSLIPLIFFPHLWLIQTNIMHEPIDHFLLIVSLLFFDYFLTTKKPALILFSLLFLLVGVLNFVGNLIWLPVYFGVYIYRNNKDYGYR